MQLRRPEPGEAAEPGDQWELTLDLGDDWYPLPLDRDPLSFADEVTEVLVEEAPLILGRQLDRERAEQIALEFRAMTEHAQQTGAFGAALYRPDYDGATTAVTVQHVFALDDGVGLQQWVEEQLALDPVAPRHREVSATELAGGPAVRVHELSGRPSGDAEAALVESVVYLLSAPGGEVVVRQAFSWTDTDDGSLVGLADRIAATIRFDRA